MHIVASAVTFEPIEMGTPHLTIKDMITTLDASGLGGTTPQVVATFAVVLGPHERGAQMRSQVRLRAPSGKAIAQPEKLEAIPPERPYTWVIQHRGAFEATEYGCYEFRLFVNGKLAATAPLYVLPKGQKSP